MQRQEGQGKSRLVLRIHQLKISVDKYCVNFKFWSYHKNGNLILYPQYLSVCSISSWKAIGESPVPPSLSLRGVNELCKAEINLCVKLCPRLFMRNAL